MMFLNKIFRFFSKSNEPLDPSYIPARRLPKTIPEVLRIEITQSGIFDRKSETLLIKTNSISTTITGTDLLAKATYSIKPSVVAEIIEMLKKKKFSSIKTRKEIRLDYPSHSITVEWGNYYLYNGESQTHHFLEKWEEVFMDCKFSILKILQNALKKNTIPVTVSIDESVIADNNNLYIVGSNSLTPYYYQNKNTFSPLTLNSVASNNYPETIQVLPGYTILKVTWHQALENKEHERIIKFPADTYAFGTMTIYLEHNQLRIKTILQKI